MAWIKKEKKKDIRVSTFKKGEYQKIYQNTKWKRLREMKFNANPLCEMCLEEGVYTNTAEVHHIIPFKYGKTPWEIKILAFSFANTMCLCVKHHKEVHTNFKINLELRKELLGY